LPDCSCDPPPRSGAANPDALDEAVPEAKLSSCKPVTPETSSIPELPGSSVDAPNRQIVPKTPTQAFDDLAEFRMQQGILQPSQSPGTTGTVARVELEGTPYYGWSSKLPGYGLSLESRRSWFDVLKGKGKLQGLDNLGDAQLLSRAEIEALLNA
jgi:hypothetical protein